MKKYSKKAEEELEKIKNHYTKKENLEEAIFQLAEKVALQVSEIKSSK